MHFFHADLCGLHIELVVTSATDATSHNKVNRDEHQFAVTNNNQQHQGSENFTAIEHAPLIADPLGRDESDDEAENELQEPSGRAFGTTGDEASQLATVGPVSNIISAKNLNETAAMVIGAVNIQTTNILQRNAAVSRDQLNSRDVIKSSSASAAANNNTATQKHHKPDAPMLNYIFDSHLTNKHRHYDPRYVYASYRYCSRRHCLCAANCNIISCLNTKFMSKE